MVLRLKLLVIDVLHWAKMSVSILPIQLDVYHTHNSVTLAEADH